MGLNRDSSLLVQASEIVVNVINVAMLLMLLMLMLLMLGILCTVPLWTAIVTEIGKLNKMYILCNIVSGKAMWHLWELD